MSASPNPPHPLLPNDVPAVTARAVYLTAAPPSVHAAGRRALGAQSPLTGRLSPAALGLHNCMLQSTASLSSFLYKRVSFA
jgi:hypothetical protein